MNSMIKFKDANEFLSFIDKMSVYNGWKLEKGIMNERGSKIKGKSYYNKLTRLFNEKGLFRRAVSVAEVVSWMDSFVIMKRLLVELKKMILDVDFNKISIQMEYRIEYSKMMRVDFMFLYEDKLLLIEYRMVDSFEKIRPTWQKKKYELGIYKELMYNYIPSDIKIYTYAMITLHEYNHKRQIMKNVEYNMNQVNHLITYLVDLVITPRIRCIY